MSLTAVTRTNQPDNAYTWTRVACDPSGSTYVAVTSNGGTTPKVSVSTDKGVTWTYYPIDTRLRNVKCIGHNGSYFLIIGVNYSASTNLLSTTSTDGITWTTPVAIAPVSSFGNGPISVNWDGTYWWALTQVTTTASSYTTLLKSTDAATWSVAHVTTVLPKNISFSRTKGSTWFAIGVASGISRMYKSVDQGSTWSACTAFPTVTDNFFSIFAVSGASLVAWDWGNNYCVRSTDDGVTWSSVWFGQAFEDAYRPTLSYGNWDGTQLVIASNRGFLLSLDNGESWSWIQVISLDDPNAYFNDAAGANGYSVFVNNQKTITATDPDIFGYGYVLKLIAQLENAKETSYSEISVINSIATLTSFESYDLVPTYGIVYVGAVPGQVPAGYQPPTLGEGIYPPRQPNPDTNLLPPSITPVYAGINRYKYHTWEARVDFIGSGPLGLSSGASLSMGVIRSISISSNLSAGGSASVVATGVLTNLAGARARIYVSFDGGQEQLLFTGTVPVDSPINIDYTAKTTSFTLVDSIEWLSQSRLSLNDYFVGSTNSAKKSNESILKYLDEFQRLDNGIGLVPDPASGKGPALTRSGVITKILSAVGFPYGASFPSSGGTLSYDVQVTGQTPMDIIRLVAESVRWQFYAKADGSLKFEPCYKSSREVQVNYWQIRAGSLYETWGRTPINSVRVSGSTQSHTAYHWKLKQIATTDGIGTLTVLDSWVTITNPDTGAEQTKHEIACWVELWSSPTPYGEGSMPIRPLRNHGVQSKGELILSPEAVIFFNDPWYVSAFSGPVAIYSPEDRFFDGYSVTFWATGVDVPADYQVQKARKYEEDFNNRKKWNQDVVIPIMADELSAYEIDFTPSAVVTDTASQSAWGPYPTTTYENQFIFTNAEAYAVANQIIDSSHRIGTMNLTLIAPHNLSTIGVGCNLKVYNTYGAKIRSSVVEQATISLSSDGSATIDATCSCKYEA